MIETTPTETILDELKQSYTVPEAARALEVSPVTIWRWVKSGRLPAYRVGPRRIRIKKEDLVKIIEPIQAESAMVIGQLPSTPAGPPPNEGIWASYDLERARAAFEATAGMLQGVDIKALLCDLRAARGQKSRGRAD